VHAIDGPFVHHWLVCIVWQFWERHFYESVCHNVCSVHTNCLICNLRLLLLVHKVVFLTAADLIRRRCCHTAVDDECRDNCLRVCQTNLLSHVCNMYLTVLWRCYWWSMGSGWERLCPQTNRGRLNRITLLWSFSLNICHTGFDYCIGNVYC